MPAVDLVSKLAVTVSGFALKQNLAILSLKVAMNVVLPLPVVLWEYIYCGGSTANSQWLILSILFIA